MVFGRKIRVQSITIKIERPTSRCQTHFKRNEKQKRERRKEKGKYFKSLNSRSLLDPSLVRLFDYVKLEIRTNVIFD